MSTIIVQIDCAAGGNSADYIGPGWAEAEAIHRWTVGRQSRLTLPVERPGPDCVLVINATPCLHPPTLTAQTVMLAVNDRLLATVRIDRLQALAFRLPSGIERDGGVVLDLLHLSCGLQRAPEQVRDGQALGLAVHGVRLYRSAGMEDAPPRARAAVEAGSMTQEERRNLALRFESLGQGCQFGLVQRQCGADPLGLLRFVDTTTSMLADGLVSAFAGIGRPGRLALHHTGDALPRYRWRHQDFGLLYDTRLPVAAWDPAVILHRESRRLGFLQRKFVEDLRLAEKIFVLTRGDCLTEEEALAVWCAMRLHGRTTLLWTVFGDPARAGCVDRLMPGFLRAQLGSVDRHGYGAFPVWLSVMANALALSD